MKTSLPHLRVNRWALAFLVAGFLGGCATPSTVPAPADEPSIRPGVNSEYLKPDLEVDTWVTRFESESREVYERRQEILKRTGIAKDMTVADIGAGTGLFTGPMARAVGPGGKVYAIDIVPKFVEFIRDQAKRLGLGNVEARLCSDRSVDLPRHSIDLAFLCDVYHHFEYPRSTLASIHQALRPHGELVVIDFRRIPGRSSDWVLNHVRAGEDEVVRELEAAGFRCLGSPLLLEENYMLRFRKHSEARPGP